MALFRALVPEEVPLDFDDKNWLWDETQREQEEGYYDTSPRKYKIQDFQRGVLEFRAVITQKDQDGYRHPSFSSVTLPFHDLGMATRTKILSLPDLRRLVVLSPHDIESFHQDGLDSIASSTAAMLKSFDTLHSIVLPVDFRTDVSILMALKDHPKLVQLELASPSTFTVRDNKPALEQLGLALALGLHELQQLQKITLPADLLTPDLLTFLGKMEHLKYLTIKPRGDIGGNNFVDMISEHDISSAHSFYALRLLDLNVAKTDPSKLHILVKRFPGIEYL
ncbi:hypothetical protein BDZ97DRAFT_1829785 [Flammula alnicola]|nr:hypothetical protein BDZ97DRAFT_1829785 [Flammula alnicola]